MNFIKNKNINNLNKNDSFQPFIHGGDKSSEIVSTRVSKISKISKNSNNYNTEKKENTNNKEINYNKDSKILYENQILKLNSEIKNEKKEEKIIKEEQLNNSFNENIRKDARGYQIKKGNKKYKVTFKDLISKEKLVTYIDIEDFKKYKINNNNTQINDIENDNTSCTCVIF